MQTFFRLISWGYSNRQWNLKNFFLRYQTENTLTEKKNLNCRRIIQAHIDIFPLPPSPRKSKNLEIASKNKNDFFSSLSVRGPNWKERKRGKKLQRTRPRPLKDSFLRSVRKQLREQLHLSQKTFALVIRVLLFFSSFSYFNFFRRSLLFFILFYFFVFAFAVVIYYLFYRFAFISGGALFLFATP